MAYVRQTSQPSVSSSIHPEMMFSETSAFLPHLGPDHSLSAFTPDPYSPATWLSNNYLPPSFPSTYHGQRSSTTAARLGEGSFTPSAPFPLSTGTHTGWTNHGNSSLQFPFEPSQSRGEDYTFNPHNIAHTTHGDVSYGERYPSRSTKHVPIPCDVTLLNVPLIAITHSY